MSLSYSPNATSADKPSAHFREEHKEIKVHLSHVFTWAGQLRDQNSKERRDTMKKIVDFFNQHIRPHAEWEERALYPAVDKRAAKGDNPFTASMRYEHRIIGRWIDDLNEEQKAKAPDAIKFARQTDKLLGLIEAHFLEEEEVLLPILDKTMSKEDFEKEILKGDQKTHL